MNQFVFEILPIFWTKSTTGRSCDFYSDRETSKFFNRSVHRSLWTGLDWIEQCFTSPPTQYRLYGRQFMDQNSRNFPHL